MTVPALWRLSLVRHAQAEIARAEQSDWDRELEPRGRRDAMEMGRRLARQGAPPQRILASPAARTLQTARILAGELGLEDGLIQPHEGLYLASAPRMLDIARALGGEARHLMIVGHNPGISEFADQLSGEHDIDDLPPCAICILHFELRRWSELEWANGVQVQRDHP
ncbi:phosphohistidine phosphatase [Steroidobacter denitrificans]|uniref:Phosphohistidine phosphatase n=2 Tax=Steroidobacter denitrificans TaxID=465721 RepID=A0A127FDD0_STEDE|nr:phosphohistidine phosphatase [Steroidobacter denitrificans]